MTKSQKVIEWLSKKFDKIRHGAGGRFFCEAII